MIVEIYKNLHKSRAANRPIYSVRDKKTRLVIDHVDSIELKNCIFKVSEVGRQRVLRERSKNVHAYVVGEACNKSKVDINKAIQVYYNPYKVEFFTNIRTGKKVYSCKRALINHSGIFIQK